jgi:hypothetical protein
MYIYAHSGQNAEYFNVKAGCILTRLCSGWTKNQCFIPSKLRDFSALHNIQTGSDANLASYPVYTARFFPSGKAAVRA